jgi:hypothetical protein
MANETEEHLRAISSRQQSTVLERIERQLTHEPSVMYRPQLIKHIVRKNFEAEF